MSLVCLKENKKVLQWSRGNGNEGENRKEGQIWSLTCGEQFRVIVGARGNYQRAPTREETRVTYMSKRSF